MWSKYYIYFHNKQNPALLFRKNPLFVSVHFISVQASAIDDKDVKSRQCMTKSRSNKIEHIAWHAKLLQAAII